MRSLAVFTCSIQIAGPTSLERQLIRFMHDFIDTVVFTTVSCGNTFVWVFLSGLAPFAVCFAVFLVRRYAYLAGGLACRCFPVCFWFFVLLIATLHVTTCVHVEFSFHCLFSCKDRASERDRPYPRKEKKRVVM